MMELTRLDAADARPIGIILHKTILQKPLSIIQGRCVYAETEIDVVNLYNCFGRIVCAAELLRLMVANLSTAFYFYSFLRTAEKIRTFIG